LKIERINCVAGRPVVLVILAEVGFQFVAFANTSVTLPCTFNAWRKSSLLYPPNRGAKLTAPMNPKCHTFDS
jgi:hypothetical protein